MGLTLAFGKDFATIQKVTGDEVTEPISMINGKHVVLSPGDLKDLVDEFERRKDTIKALIAGEEIPRSEVVWSTGAPDEAFRKPEGV